jgi:hypothetical protein
MPTAPASGFQGRDWQDQRAAASRWPDHAMRQAARACDARAVMPMIGDSNYVRVQVLNPVGAGN